MEPQKERASLSSANGNSESRHCEGVDEHRARGRCAVPNNDDKANEDGLANTRVSLNRRRTHICRGPATPARSKAVAPQLARIVAAPEHQSTSNNIQHTRAAFPSTRSLDRSPCTNKRARARRKTHEHDTCASFYGSARRRCHRLRRRLRLRRPHKDVNKHQRSTYVSPSSARVCQSLDALRELRRRHQLRRAPVNS